MPRIRWKATLTAQELAPLIAIADASIAAIQADIQQQHAFVPYHAGGAQQAVTTVNWPPAGPQRYTTHMQEHSEMVAVASSTGGVAPIWAVNAGGHVVANNGVQIQHANYFTDLPHCGYCTVMLWVLDLPLGAPTEGRYNLAVNLEYTVPANVLNNVDLLSRLLNANAGGNAALIVLKKMINPFLQNQPAEWVLQVAPGVFVSDTAVTAAAPPATLVLDWTTEAAPHRVDVNVQYFGKNTLLVTVWKIVYQGIYDNVQ
ncbi:MAG: hypothetical protein KUA43_12765 [Hoeflea sp.]|uniref:hypothetical protein n=1 Tax=Hoeflea sp. TaxID=1940281 RepID=UPI001DFC7319|nr:hypothetical protein [Hoeflea sp.]MBU4527885.1 hypothetical protein [Alphaproteobacteria bacterium]MBU4546080.1 hypothetical protein [Alphaproteobacteria bacterium]MBU4553235.1 hypothetical protein [Alphaproteobacteria bacterium]MBV1724307.1 hypothetical protein [Hoeflea sp.]MBV1759992.1 hypothetical protein [Hoeflea sp.]